ncbi:MAG: adenylate/guanylate cyclase domain-containing protein [Thermoanaerobacterales bacterium]|jgi:adenylate cyclase|nr:adenylate/guanylate cyclase domain-containing protein [Thermoanaerobacterales bacterium]
MGDRAGAAPGADEVRRWLAARGVDGRTDGARGIDDERLAGLAGDLVIERASELSAREVAERAGVPLSHVVGMFHDLGVIVPDVDAPLFSSADVTFVERMHVAAEVGIVQGRDILRVVAGAMERIAEAAVAVYVQGLEGELRRQGASLAEMAEANVRATSLALELGVGLGAVFRHHMRQAVARQRVVQEGVARRELARLAVGFVDLVGSTGMQAGLDPDELGAFVSRFESRAFEVVAAHEGRLVKFIGDAIMFAAVDPAAGCRIAADLVRTFTADGTQPRGGLVFGEVLFRHGDYYGPVVNLASRLAATAIPGEVLVDAAVAEALADDEELAFEPAGRRMLKGFDRPVTVWSLDPAA